MDLSQSSIIDHIPSSPNKLNNICCINTATPKKLQSIDLFEGGLSTNKKNDIACMRCSVQSGTTTCHECNSVVYCLKCDKQVHGFGKFRNHHRASLLSQSQYSVQQSLSKDSNLIQQTQSCINEAKFQAASIMLSQMWDSLISQVFNKFQCAIDLLEDKRTEIIQKIERKRIQETKIFLNSCKEFSVQTEQQISVTRNKPSKFVIKQTVSSCSTIYSENYTNLYKVSQKMFNGLQDQIKKIYFKNTILKSTDESQLQNTKKKMRCSLIMGSNEYTALSPNTKLSSHLKSQLSQSTLQFQNVEQKSQKNKKITQANSTKELKQIKILSRARSQKLIFKSPNNQKYIKQKATVKKIGKL